MPLRTSPLRWLLAALVAGPSLAACHGASPPPPAASVPPSPQEPPPDTSPLGQYRAVKASLAAIAAGTLKARVLDGELDLYNCNSIYDFAGQWAEGDDAMVRMGDLATEVLTWSETLEKFPKSTWQAAIANYERDELDRRLKDTGSIEGSLDTYAKRKTAFLKSLAPVLNAARATDPTLPKVIVEGGCGAGEIPVKIVTDPRGAQVLFIPSFFHELCRAQKLDPDDPARCTRWREALDGSLTHVAGDYFYVAKWADGTTRRGKLSITGAQEGGTITLGKPR